ncbi:hypothetical protein PI125_g14695 [Phytophthora idaei]|nr:hypothetical protein PI125_g14695 [Phytophthora idaei]
MRCRHYLTVQCLVSPSGSAWMMLYRYGSDLKILNATSLTISTDLRSTSFVTGSMEQSTLCMLFGAPPSPLSRTRRRAEEALDKALNGKNSLVSGAKAIGEVQSLRLDCRPLSFVLQVNSNHDGLFKTVPDRMVDGTRRFSSATDVAVELVAIGVLIEAKSG